MENVVDKLFFIKILEEIKRQLDFAEKINNISYECNQETNLFLSHGYLIDYLVDILEKDYNTDIIEYWVFELNCGKEYHHGSIRHKNGKYIKLITPVDVYNFIKGNFNFEEE